MELKDIFILFIFLPLTIHVNDCMNMHRCKKCLLIHQMNILSTLYFVALLQCGLATVRVYALNDAPTPDILKSAAKRKTNKHKIQWSQMHLCLVFYSILFVICLSSLMSLLTWTQGRSPKWALHTTLFACDLNACLTRKLRSWNMYWDELPLSRKFQVPATWFAQCSEMTGNQWLP